MPSRLGCNCEINTLDTGSGGLPIDTREKLQYHLWNYTKAKDILQSLTFWPCLIRFLIRKLLPAELKPWILIAICASYDMASDRIQYLSTHVNGLSIVFLFSVNTFLLMNKDNKRFSCNQSEYSWIILGKVP